MTAGLYRTIAMRFETKLQIFQYAIGWLQQSGTHVNHPPPHRLRALLIGAYLGTIPPGLPL